MSSVVTSSQTNWIPMLINGKYNITGRSSRASDKEKDKKGYQPQIAQLQHHQILQVTSPSDRRAKSLSPKNSNVAAALTLSQLSSSVTSNRSNTSSTYNVVGKYPPSLNHILAHLKLIKFFRLLREQVSRESDWDLFLKSGVRRFIWFLTIVRNKLKPNNKYFDEAVQISHFKGSSNSKYCTQNLKTILPPIDILYIWYVLSLRTKSFYEMGIRFQFLEFTLMSFPIFPATQSINMNMEYTPHLNFVNNFMLMTGNHIRYDWKGSLGHRVPVNCPVCQHKLGSVLLKDFSRFSFPTPAPNGCRCKFQGTVTFRQLIKRQLYSDITSNERPLPLIHQTKSHYLYEVGTSESVDDLDELDKSLKSILKKDIHRLKSSSVSSEMYFQDIDSNFENIYSNFYNQMNLLHLTIPLGCTNPVQITESWTNINSREKFIDQVSGLTSWLESENVLLSGIARYETFFKLIAESFRFYSLVPLLDTDLIWQTHKLSPHEYIEYSRSRCQNNLIDSNDGIENNLGTSPKNDSGDQSDGESLSETDPELSDELAQATNFKVTCQLYKSLYHKSYTDCRCYYCFKSARLIQRSQYSPKIKEFCTSTKPCSKVSHYSTSIVHSTHLKSNFLK